MSDVFISYARENRDKAELLANSLVSRGLSVWWDRQISPGKAYDRVIEEQLATAKCVIVLWSKYSVASDWVRAEAEEGRNQGILIPAMLDESRMPLAFRSIQAADLTNWDGTSRDENYQDVLRAISSFVPHVNPPTTDVRESAPPHPVVADTQSGSPVEVEPAQQRVSEPAEIKPVQQRVEVIRPASSEDAGLPHTRKAPDKSPDKTLITLRAILIAFGSLLALLIVMFAYTGINYPVGVPMPGLLILAYLVVIILLMATLIAAGVKLVLRFIRRM